jgi:glutamate-ammonia-ligase adenylyltransferase
VQPSSETAPLPNRQTLRQDVTQRCPDVPLQVIDELFAQLDDDYFTLYTAPQIAAHVLLLAAVDDQHPVQVRVIARSDTSADMLVAAYDLFGEFSIITGLIAAYSLNIRGGQVFSYHRGPERVAPWGATPGGRIVDVFTVEYAAEHPFDSTAQALFTTQLTTLIQLLRQGKLQEARASLNYQIIDTMRISPQAFSAHLFPVEIALDNDASADWTVVHIHADDTPAFLYSLSNALAMRDIYIYRVSITSTLGIVHNQLFVGWRRGGKIASATGQRELRLIVILIKQFTHFLTVAPDPAMALQHFDRLVDRLAGDAAHGEELHWLWEENTLKVLATVLGSSHFLWEDFLRLHHDTLLPVLKDLRAADQHLRKDDLTARLGQALQGATTPAERKQALNTFKDRELFRIDMRHLLHRELPFGMFADELADLAEVVLAAALTLAHETLQERYGSPLLADGRACAFALFGLGKLGGRELGYASDLEILCVYSGQGYTSGPHQIAVSQYAEMLIQQLLDLIVVRRSGTFEIDLRLRPFGSKGPLATSLDAFREYYRYGGQAAPFERQALIKLRWMAGDTSVGQTIETLRDAFVYSAAPFDLETAVQLRQRQRNELVVPGVLDAKYSQGGLVDIEYTVQYLQLLHGATIPALHTPNTLAALQALSHAGIVSATVYQALRDAYVFLRRLIDALRLARGNAHDLVLPPMDSEDFIFLARRMGYWEEQDTPAQLAHTIAHHMQQAARLYTAYCLR